MAQAALISPMWLNACGKLPSSSPVAGSTSSASRPDVVDVARRPARTPPGPGPGLPGHGERLRQPERAQQEGALRRRRGRRRRPRCGSGRPARVRRSAAPRWRRSWPARAGRSAGRNPTIGIIRLEASSAAEPKYCVNAPARVVPALAQRRSRRISSRVRRQPTRPGRWRRAGRPARSPRSSATQHMTFEYRKCRGSPRTSQMPWSFSRQRSAAVSAQATRKRRRRRRCRRSGRRAGGPRRAARRTRRSAAGSRRRCRRVRGGCPRQPGRCGRCARSGRARRRRRT